MLKVYTNRPDHFFYYNVKMTADYCNYPIETVVVDEETQNTKEFKAKKGHRQFPIMETPAGALVSESTAIAAYIARAAGNKSFIGNSAFEEAQIAQWTTFACSSIAPHMKNVAYQVFGWKDDKAAYDAAVKAIKEAVKHLNTQLQDKAWIACDRLTMADIVSFNALLLPYTFVLDGGFRKAMPAAAEWFLKMSKLPVVTRTAGYVKWVGAGLESQGGAPANAGKAKGGKAKGGKAAPAKKEQPKKEEPKKEEPKPAAAAPAEDDDDFDPFAEEDPEEAAKAAEALKKKNEEAKEKKKKAAPVAKSLIVWEVKPWGEETDLKVLADKIIGIEMDGLFWKTEWKKEPVAYGVFKIVIGATVEDEKVSTDLVEEKIMEFDEEVQSVDIVAFNKL